MTASGSGVLQVHLINFWILWGRYEGEKNTWTGILELGAKVKHLSESQLQATTFYWTSHLKQTLLPTLMHIKCWTWQIYQIINLWQIYGACGEGAGDQSISILGFVFFLFLEWIFYLARVHWSKVTVKTVEIYFLYKYTTIIEEKKTYYCFHLNI